MKKIVLIGVVVAVVYATFGVSAANTTTKTVKSATSSLDAKIEAATK